MSAHLRVQVRTMDDGWTRAGVQLGEEGSPWMVLAMVATPPYNASEQVQSAFIELAKAVMLQAISEALPGVKVERTAVVAPGASLDDPKH